MAPLTPTPVKPVMWSITPLKSGVRDSRVESLGFHPTQQQGGSPHWGGVTEGLVESQDLHHGPALLGPPIHPYTSVVAG